MYIFYEFTMYELTGALLLIKELHEDEQHARLHEKPI